MSVSPEDMSSLSPEDSSGVSLVQTLHERYGEDHQVSFIVHLSKPPTGLDHDPSLPVLPPVLGLNQQGISCLGDRGELTQLCRSVTDINLTDNNVTDWDMVLSLLECLPQLQYLNISRNPVCASGPLSQCLAERSPDTTAAISQSAVSRLVMNRLQTPWTDVWDMLKLLPRVFELQLSVTGLRCLDPPPDGATFPSVTSLYLNENQITECEELANLGRMFPSLQNLALIGNPIKTLCSDPEVLRETFPQLVYVNVSQTLIDSWEQLESLRNCPKLTEVRMQKIPLVESYSEELRRQLAIAYLPSVVLVNASPVSAAEREDAERAFIRHHMADAEKPARYHELVSTYGELDPLAVVDLSKASDTLSILVHFGEKQSLRSLSLRATVTQIKQELASFVGRPPSEFVLYYRDVGGPYGDEHMRYNTRTLLRYNAKDGDEIFVELKKK